MTWTKESTSTRWPSLGLMCLGCLPSGGDGDGDDGGDVMVMVVMVMVMVMMMTCWQHSKVFLLQRLSHLPRQKLKLPPKGASAKPLVLKFIMFRVFSMMVVMINF